MNTVDCDPYSQRLTANFKERPSIFDDENVVTFTPSIGSEACDCEVSITCENPHCITCHFCKHILLLTVSA